MKRTVLFATMALLFTVFATNVNAQEGNRKRIDLKAQDLKESGANPEVKADRPATDAPKTGTRGSGPGTCYAYLHNYTSYTIDIYVDGYWEGTLSAWGDAYVATGTGYTTMYGRSIGKTKEWKFNGATCNSYLDYYFY
ncbi:MAG: hypothetical protein KIS94_10795 [Chitinophagales bacterium]|nr:hypothetical protein [Chitinophagales bacterium]